MSDRMAYMADLDNPYITLDNDYIETVLVDIQDRRSTKASSTKDYKILPYCPRCGTGLASHEVAQGYKDGQGTNTLTCKFKKKGSGQRVFPRMDDDALDARIQHRAYGRTGHRLCKGEDDLRRQRRKYLLPRERTRSTRFSARTNTKYSKRLKGSDTGILGIRTAHAVLQPGQRQERIHRDLHGLCFHGRRYRNRSHRAGFR